MMAPVRLNSCDKPFPAPGTATPQIGSTAPTGIECWERQWEQGRAPLLLSEDGISALILAAALSSLALEISEVVGEQPLWPGPSDQC